ncbi:DUF2283 domain-containing protein [Gloeobacter morelensis]|uniref:DUF2283 domain-containing protein n=1 Tax=Gloeobacter morelensis MG652769 TaxID=2781736 RepID=A0ABY3PKT7_9CYAN|nr:DUF2283 domain-containing protein [Gloeobacter morelensis]UFP94271.1 DUF2283 domain-containing protein [Gloeobacter morelensis MG652769]
MKITYDERYNIAYLQIQETSAAARTVSVGEDINIDILEDGSVAGIEFLNAQKQLLLASGEPLVLINSTLNQVKKISLM